VNLYGADSANDLAGKKQRLLLDAGDEQENDLLALGGDNR
jgi:hypothetical protein